MIKNVAVARPRVPPFSRPRLQPKYMPEITYPTPSPHNIIGLRVRFNETLFSIVWFLFLLTINVMFLAETDLSKLKQETDQYLKQKLRWVKKVLTN